MSDDPTRLADTEQGQRGGVELHRLAGTVKLDGIDGSFDVSLDPRSGVAEVHGPDGTHEVEAPVRGGDLIQRMLKAARDAHEAMAGVKVRLGHYEVHPSTEDELWRFRFKANNGRITSVSSEGYRDRHDGARAAMDDAEQHGCPADIQIIDSDA